MRILITGSRNWTNREIIRQALREAGQAAKTHPQGVVVVHGGARGADMIAGEIAREFGCMIEVHPADWQAHGKAAGPIRNAHMVKLGADVCLAFPLGESRGTRHCMHMAEAAGIPVKVYEGATS